MKISVPETFPQQNRPVTMAPHGMVTSPHYLASQAGVDILKKGGSECERSFSLCREYGIF
jgi:gamma-glutamyltranspeptidase